MLSLVNKMNNLDRSIYSLVQLFQKLNVCDSVREGRQLHLLFIKKGLLGSSLVFCNRLLQMYARCCSMADALQLFDDMPVRNHFSWNTMIEGYVKSGDLEKALGVFETMADKNGFSWNLVISAFLKTGEIDFARKLFDDMPEKNGVVWNSMLHAYVRNGRPKEALRLFKNLSFDSLDVSRYDSFVLATVIRACTDLLYCHCGRQIHAHVITNKLEFDSALGSSLINFYGKCCDLDYAGHVLNMMKEPDDFSLSALIYAYASCSRPDDARRIFNRKICCQSVVVWNSMISGYVQNSKEMEALELFYSMRRLGIHADSSTLASILSASSSFGIYVHVKQMHKLVLNLGLIDDIVVASSLVDAYCKCGNPNDACRLFGELKAHDTILLNSMITAYSICGKIAEAKRIFTTMPRRSLVSWNSMIVGLCQNGFPIEAINLLQEMSRRSVLIDEFTVASVISACGCISSLELGVQVFSKAVVSGLESDAIISTSLVDFFCKCGLVENARKIFDRMIKSDGVSWNSMLMGYATNGHGIEALALFEEMMVFGIKPNYITFIGVLSACNHCGLVEEGQRRFNTMKSNYHIDPGIEHYSCMVDLYSRAGSLEEAVNVAKHMPFKADVSTWSSILRGCVAHGNKILGVNVAKRIIELDTENSPARIQLASILATNLEWEGSAEVHQVMKHKNIRKSPGRSWSDRVS